MFHEEKIIDGKLCWRGTPKGEWIAFTAEQLTAKLGKAKAKFERPELYEKAPWWANPDLPAPKVTL